MGEVVNFDKYRGKITEQSRKVADEKAKGKAGEVEKVINFDEYRGKITEQSREVADKKAKEEAEKLAEERMQAYTDFLAIIENLKKMDNRKEMNRVLAEIAKAALRKIPPDQAIGVIKHYEKIISHYLPD